MGTDLKTILYAEDEPDIRAIARVSLERVGGFTLEMRNSGAELIEALDLLEPDLILLDVMMPDGDGPTTLAAIRRHPRAAAVPVMFITARNQAAEIAELKRLGAIGVLSKPFDPMTLPDTIRSLWDRYHHGRS